MSMSDQTAVVLIILTFFSFLTAWAYLAYNTPDDTIIWDARVESTTDQKVKVLHPTGDYIWAGKNFHSVGLGDYVVIKMKNNNAYIIEEVKE